MRKSGEWRPSAKQVRMAGLLLDFETPRTKAEACEAAGVSAVTLWRWLRDEDFTAYLNKEIERFTDGAVAGVWQALIAKASAGDVSAMKLFFELKNLYKAKGAELPARLVVRWEE